MSETQLPDDAATVALGRQLAEALREPVRQRGCLLLLEGPLGAGKTTLTRGLAEGLGCIAHVSSPTFALMHEYPAGVSGVEALIHIDAYRLDGPDAFDAATGGLNELQQPGVLVVVE